MKTSEEFYMCSELRRTKCPCMVAGGDQGLGEEDDHGCEGDILDDDSLFEEDPRDNKLKYDVVSLDYKLSKLSIRILKYFLFIQTLVWASNVEDHASYHEIDLMDAKSEELKEKMTELMKADPILDPSIVIDKILNEYTDKMEGPMKAELISVFYRTRRESHLR